MAERATVARITGVRFSPSALEQSERSATRNFIPSSALLRSKDKKEEMKMKILFICKYNRFRSQIAETYFRKINRDKTIKSYSAGIIIGTPIAKNVKDIGKKFGLKINGKPKSIREKLLKEIDLLIIVANNVPEQLFETKTRKLIKWNIPDTSQGDLCDIERISKMIMKKVDELNKQLEDKK